MAPPRSREHLTLSYDPRAAVTSESLAQLMRQLEGMLQRLELRIEHLQDEVESLAQRISTLER